MEYFSAAGALDIRSGGFKIASRASANRHVRAFERQFLCNRESQAGAGGDHDRHAPVQSQIHSCPSTFIVSPSRPCIKLPADSFTSDAITPAQ